MKTLLGKSQSELEQTTKRLKKIEKESQSERDKSTKRIRELEEELEALKQPKPYTPFESSATVSAIEFPAQSADTTSMDQDEPLLWEATACNIASPHLNETCDSSMSMASTISLDDVCTSGNYSYLFGDEDCGDDVVFEKI